MLFASWSDERFAVTFRSTPDWRHADDYARLRGIDRAGLMWEWLRRDPGYVAWYTRASTATRGARAATDDPAQWGIHFRGMPGPRRARGPDPLARRCRSRHAHRHCHSDGRSRSRRG
ncbi:transcriptional regulator domain-containing protein [Sphingomonas sp.]|uniref:transcriptional regulator domain-containing protein n=1 Tax=Sphingomonas sp. TaxID=28214 RepID=UPI003566C740